MQKNRETEAPLAKKSAARPRPFRCRTERNIFYTVLTGREHAGRARGETVSRFSRVSSAFALLAAQPARPSTGTAVHK